jgi:hypothetical protein
MQQTGFNPAIYHQLLALRLDNGCYCYVGPSLFPFTFTFFLSCVKLFAFSCNKPEPLAHFHCCLWVVWLHQKRNKSFPRTYMSPAINLLFALGRFLLGASLRDWFISSTCQFNDASRVSRRCLWLRGTALSDGYRLLSCRWLGSVSAVSMIRVLAFQPVCIPVEGHFCQADSTVDHHRSNRRDSQPCICEKAYLNNHSLYIYP